MNLSFTWDAEANGWISEEFTINSEVVVHIALTELAPVVTLKQMDDGDWANYGQTPDESDQYHIAICPSHEMRLRLASPVRVKKCTVLVDSL